MSSYTLLEQELKDSILSLFYAHPEILVNKINFFYLIKELMEDLEDDMTWIDLEGGDENEF